MPRQSTYRGFALNNFVLDSILLGKIDSDRGTTQGTKDKASSSSRKWNEYTTEGKLDPFLRDFPKSMQAEIFSSFAQKLRHNYAGRKAQDGLRGSSVRTEINAISASFRDVGLADPIRHASGELVKLLKDQIEGYEDADPPPIQQSPAPIQVFDLIKRVYLCPQDTACSQLIEGALFFGMRSCEYIKTPGYLKKRTTLLELRDISFYNEKSILLPHNSANLLSEALTVKITYRKQKHKENCQEVSITKSPNRLCSVDAWCKIVTRVRLYPGSNDNTFVCTYFCPVSGKYKQITNDHVTNMLRSAVEIIGPEIIGVPLNRVGTHTIRTSFALFMSLGKEEDSVIMLKGRWKSAAFMKYIRGYIDKFGVSASTSISNPVTGNFVNLHTY